MFSQTRLQPQLRIIAAMRKRIAIVDIVHTQWQIRLVAHSFACRKLTRKNRTTGEDDDGRSSLGTSVFHFFEYSAHAAS